MIRIPVLFTALLCLSLAVPALASFEYSFENTNIFTYSDSYSDFNRIRFKAVADAGDDIPVSSTVIIDNNSFYSQDTNTFDNDLDLYRAYLEYAGEKLNIILGKQRVPFGVGRIYNPIDIFNPIDITRIEPQEREGTDSLRMEYAISMLSSADITLSQDKNAFRIKGFLHYLDIALIAIADDEEDRFILGWELEGELLGSGIELRSEGGSFYNREKKEYQTEFILGAEYGLANSLTVLVEYNFNDERAEDNLGSQLSYQLSPLLSLRMIGAYSLNDHSYLIVPTMQYSLSDEMTLDGGFFLFQGDDRDLYGGPNLFFLSWFIHF